MIPEGFSFESQEDLVKTLKKAVDNKNVKNGLKLFSKGDVDVSLSGNMAIIKNEKGEFAVIDLNEIKKSNKSFSLGFKKNQVIKQ